jgi:citrate/tricarballylate utilization protein
VPPPEPPRASIPLTLVREGERLMHVCNACRYCEGFCAMFPAMERRLAFSEQDLTYLANLCHDCRECYYSCQYAPPHEFHVNVPKTFAAIRRETYRKYSWPHGSASLFTRSGLVLILAAAVVPAVFTTALGIAAGRSAMFAAHSVAAGAFYEVMPHAVMTGLFGALGGLTVVPFVVGLVRFWRDAGGGEGSFLDARALGRASADTLALRYLDGGGDGCAYPDEVPTKARRWFHHLTFYGFMLCFAATSVAAVYHNVLGWRAPYDLVSVPVLLGCAGGIGLLVGPAGLLRLRAVRDPEPGDRVQSRMDVAFIVLLFLTSLSGFLLLALRETSAMGVALGAHLGLVTGLFLTLPYGKFVHAIYRFCALVRNALEERHERRLL